MKIEKSVDLDVDISVCTEVGRVNTVREDSDVGAKFGCGDNEVME